MDEYHAADSHKITATRPRRGAGTIILLAVAVFALFMGALLATGFWSADIKDKGEMPNLKLSVTDGRLPVVEIKSKTVVVGNGKVSVDAASVRVKSEHRD